MSFVALGEVLNSLLKARSGAFKLGVAIDGSGISDKAMEVATGFVNIKRGDTLSIIHISDKGKTYLARNLEPERLRRRYEDMAGVYIKPEWICKEKEEGENTCSALTSLADKTAVDLLVLGSWGRKGEKLDLLGTVSDYSLRESHSSICIVRKEGHASGPTKFLFATDGSRAAALAFCTLTQLLMKPGEVVDVVMVSTEDGTVEKPTVDHYRDFMTEHKISGQAFVKCVDRSSSSIPDGVLDAAREVNADVLCLGISGYGRKKLGSVSEKISMLAHCTTIVFKDGYEVLSDRYATQGAVAAEIRTGR